MVQKNSGFVPVHERNIILLVNGFQPKYQRAIEKLSKRLGRPLRGIVLLDKGVKEHGLYDKDKEGVYENIVCDFSDELELHKIISSFKGKVLMVLGMVERNQLYVQKLLPHVPYTLNPTETSFDWATNKVLMRQMLAAYDESLVPKVCEIKNSSESEILKIADTLTFPLIVKPAGLAGSVMVTKVENLRELRACVEDSFAQIKRIYHIVRGRGRPSLLVEEFIHGDMYTIDGYVSSDGQVWILPPLAARTAYALGGTGFYEREADSFLSISNQDIIRAQTAAMKATYALGLRSCAIHIELFHTKAGWKIIELGARIGGQRYDIYKTAYGIDHAYNELLVKAGLEPEMPSGPVAYAASFNVCAEQNGTLQSIEGIKAAKAIASLDHFASYIQPGSNCRLMPEICQPIYHGVIRANSKEQAIADRKKLLDMIKLNITI